jgi:WD40 repeat protein
MASCSHDRRIKIYDLRTQKIIQNYEAHKGPVTSVDFHPYSANLLSTGDDGKTKIWDLRRGCLSYTLDTNSS